MPAIILSPYRGASINTGNIYGTLTRRGERERVQNKPDSYLSVSNRLMHALGLMCLVAINSALTQRH